MQDNEQLAAGAASDLSGLLDMAGTKMIKCVVPISGGKDSQACVKLALQKFDKSEVLGLFCDTKFEHPLTYAHVDKISEMYGVRIVKVNNGDVISLVRKYKRFPNGGSRFCTDRLKLTPAKAFYKKLAHEQGRGFEVWLGMRSGESHQRAQRYKNNISEDLYPPHELMPSSFPQLLAKLGIMFKLPILDWSTEDVFEFLDGEQSPLYALGSSRVGCFPCLAAGDASKERDFAMDDFGQEQRKKVVKIGKEINQNVFTSKKIALRNLDTMVTKVQSWQDDMFDAPCMMCHI